MLSSAILSTLALALSATASPVEKRAVCSSYTIISTRGTFEPQGESFVFKDIHSQVLSRVPGGSVYNVVYPAGADQQSGAATTDITKQINDGLKQNPNQCFVVEGYSQGAAASVNALIKTYGDAYKAVKAVLFFGNPYHKSGLSCNVDETGGTTTKYVNGISQWQGIALTNDWLKKTRDVCWKGDGICDTANGGLNINHLLYASSADLQEAAADFIVSKLQG